MSEIKGKDHECNRNSHGSHPFPTLVELQSILVDKINDLCYEIDCGKWVKTIPQIQLGCGWIWTSEGDPVVPAAKIFNFNNVYHYTVRKAHKRGYRALPVRNLK